MCVFPRTVLLTTFDVHFVAGIGMEAGLSTCTLTFEPLKSAC